MPSCCDEVRLVCVIDDTLFFGEEVFLISVSNHDKKYSPPTLAVQGQLVQSELFNKI
jgi:hypothetical protein